MLEIEAAFIESNYDHNFGTTRISIKVYPSDNTCLSISCIKEEGAIYFAEALEEMAKAIRDKL